MAIIFDLGLHSGDDTEFYLKKGFDVVAVEANPHLVAAAEQKFSNEVRMGRLTIVPYAIAPEAGKVRFYLNRTNTAWSSVYESWGSRKRGADIVEVIAITPRMLFEQYGIPYYLKIDLEGMDEAVMRALEYFDKPQYISFEGVGVPGFNLLAGYGYRKFAIVNQARVHTQKLPCPAKEGDYVDHVFMQGSSGSFGQELPVSWMSLEEATAERNRIDCLRRSVADRFPNSESKRHEAMKAIGWFDMACIALNWCEAQTKADRNGRIA